MSIRIVDPKIKNQQEIANSSWDHASQRIAPVKNSPINYTPGKKPMGFDISASKSEDEESRKRNLHKKLNFDESGALAAEPNLEIGAQDSSLFPKLETRGVCFYDIDWKAVFQSTMRMHYQGPKDNLQDYMLKDDSGLYDYERLEAEGWPLKNYLIRNGCIHKDGQPNINGIIRALNGSIPVIDGEALAFALGDTNRINVEDYRKLQDAILGNVIELLLVGNTVSAFEYIEAVFPHIGMEYFQMQSDQFPLVLQPQYLMKAPSYISHPKKKLDEVRAGFIEKGVPEDDSNLDTLVEQMAKAKDSVIFWQRMRNLDAFPLKAGGYARVIKQDRIQETESLGDIPRLGFE